MKKTTYDLRTGRAHFLLLAACLLAAACVQVDTAPSSGEGAVRQIKQGTTGSFEGLRIGFSSIGPGQSADGKKPALVAVLVLFIAGKQPQEKQFELRAGERAVLDKYTVYVQEIRGGSKGSVKLEVKSSGEPAAQ